VVRVGISAGTRVGVEGLGHSEIGWTGRAAELASDAAHAQGASFLPATMSGRRLALTPASKVSIRLGKEGRAGSSVPRLRALHGLRLGGSVEADPGLGGQPGDPLGS
jgi:hypothetical protein